MDNKASLTALMSAFGRAYHTQNAENPIFRDAVAQQLMTSEEYQTMGNYILSGVDFFAPDKKSSFRDKDDLLRYLTNTQIAPTPVARARFCEDSLKTALLTGTSQYVILGAGMDNFAFREKGLMKRMTLFEADHPLTQKDKQKRILRAGLEIPDNLHFVPVDFGRQNLRESLLAAGFDPSKKTFFSWLGVSYYLSREETETMLSQLASLCAEGSSLVFDYGNEWLLSSEIRRVKNMIAMAAAGGEPMKSCYDYPSLERMLERHGFLIFEHLDARDIQERYFDGRTDGLAAFEHIHYATAVYK